LVEEIAAALGAADRRLYTGGWELQVRIYVILIAALLVLGLVGAEIDPREVLLVLLHERNDGDVLCHGVELADAAIIDQCAFKIKILFVVLVEHSCRDIRDIASSVTFTSNIDFIIADSESLLKVLEEANEVLCNVFLRLRLDCAS
jgi:hypothetical protein